MCLAIPGRIISIDDIDPLIRLARVDFGEVIKEISLAYTPRAQIGDYVLVHVGFSLTVIDPVRARQTLEDIEAICALQEADPMGENS